MSNNWKHQTELQLMEVSQDCMSISQQQDHKQANKVWATSPYSSADDWNDSWNDSISGDDFVDLEELVDTDLDSDIIDFSIDEF